MPDLEGPAPDLVGDDPIGAYDGAMAEFSAALRRRARSIASCRCRSARCRARPSSRSSTWDLAVHCWDLATATGQAFPLGDDDVAVADAIARGFLAPEMRDGDTFAAEVEVGPDATPVERMVAVRRSSATR